MDLPRIGDQSAVRTRGSSSAVAMVRVDAVLLLVHDDGLGAAATAPGLTVFARLLAERARQAQDGPTPDATAPAPDTAPGAAPDSAATT